MENGVYGNELYAAPPAEDQYGLFYIHAPYTTSLTAVYRRKIYCVLGSDPLFSIQ